MRIPTIGELMTPAPRTIGEDIQIPTAKAHMINNGFRHLPVLRGGRLVGIISDRDVKVAESFTGGVLTVGDVMTPEPYVVDESEPIDRVLMTMSERKYGCALVHRADREVLVGIFTDTDALRFAAELLRKPLSESPLRRTA